MLENIPEKISLCHNIRMLNAINAYSNAECFSSDLQTVRIPLPVRDIRCFLCSVTPLANVLQLNVFLLLI
jgi:hypothetical protein